MSGSAVDGFDYVGLSMGSSGADLSFRRSEVRYAQIGDESVAYRVIEGTRGGAHDVVLLLSGTASMEALFEDPVGVRLFEGLADLGRLVVFDRRGIGLSDPPADSTGSGLPAGARTWKQLSRPQMWCAPLLSAP
jgi:pimeloyl-ACP methyl ester carboxylesterase